MYSFNQVSTYTCYCTIHYCIAESVVGESIVQLIRPVNRFFFILYYHLCCYYLPLNVPNQH